VLVTGFILVLVSFVYSLVKAAQCRRWGWFVGLLIGFVVLGLYAPALGTIGFAL
jgi:hypothetical protein